MKTHTLTGLLGLCALASDVWAENANAERLEWFKEARFGMFIHWGVYSVPAGEWQGKPVGSIGEWIMKNGKIPVADYKGFAKDFTASNYDPSAWAKLAKGAGMKYVVITSKHHDGFALYDSKVTDWDVMSSGAKRDLLAPLAKAVRTEGLKFGLYYSQAQDWTHPGGGKYGNQNWDPAQSGDYDSYLKTIALPQTEEIITAYQPDIIWWDTPVNMTRERGKPFADLLSLHPAIITNNRLGQGYDGDTMTPEQHIPPRGYPGKMFEVCMTMNDTWGYKKNDHNWKSARQLLQNLSDIASKGGNFLLNVGPTADGVIPPESVERLKAVGCWMDVNGEAIYSTDASPFPRRLPWGRVTQKAAAGGATTLYLHVWDWPADGRLLLPTLKELPAAGKLLKGGAMVTAKNSVDGVIVQLPGAATDADVSIVRLDFPGSLTITQLPFIMPAADGTISLLAADADTFGGLSGNIHLRGSGPSAYLTDWTSPEYRLEYQIKTSKTGKWRVAAEVAAPQPVKLALNVKKSSTPVEIPVTGPGLSWKNVQLGSIELPAGESTLELKSVKENWHSISLRALHLIPE
jgi:alpha-L-fucosidase